MSKSKRQILILVEGAKTDFKLMKRLLEIYGISHHHQIVSYNTNIYTLYNEMFYNQDPSEVDLLQNLKEHENNPEKKIFFDQYFSDILLIFDLDPQDPQFSPDKILEMAHYFVESSDMGKLYINYPMVEAFYHMKAIPDPAFYDYYASLKELKDHTYKARVNHENRNHDQRKFAATKSECSIVIQQNMEKGWILQKQIKDDDQDIFVPDHTLILEAQLEVLRERHHVSVLCTCVYYIAEYNPALIV